MWTATRLQILSIELIISISLCFALMPAADQPNNRSNVISGSHFKPQLLSTHNNAALTEDALKSHDESKQYTTANGNSDEEARVLEEILDALGPVINKLRGEGTSSLTEPLLQTDAKIGEGDKKLVMHLQAMTTRTEAQDSALVAAIETLRNSEDPSDRTFGDFELINVLENPALAEIVYENWFSRKDSPLAVIKSLDPSFTDSNPESRIKFLEHHSALKWLSYVGFCWKHNRFEFNEENLYQFFEEAHLSKRAMAGLLYDARLKPYGWVVLDRMQRTRTSWSNDLSNYIFDWSFWH